MDTNIYDEQEKMIITLKEALENVSPGKKYVIGYYDIELIEQINTILSFKNMHATYYGDNCTMYIFNK